MITPAVLRDFINAVEQIVIDNYTSKTPEAIRLLINQAAERYGVPKNVAESTRQKVEVEKQRAGAKDKTVIPDADVVSFIVDAAQDTYEHLTADVLDVIRRSGTEDVVQKIKRIARVKEHHAVTLERTARNAIAREQHLRNATKSEPDPLMRYAGPETGIRKFCSDNIGVVKRLSEWRNTTNSFGQNAALFCGGYNCRHRLVVVKETK